MVLAINAKYDQYYSCCIGTRLGTNAAKYVAQRNAQRNMLPSEMPIEICCPTHFAKSTQSHTLIGWDQSSTKSNPTIFGATQTHSRKQPGPESRSTGTRLSLI
jgi:hypothetical protein